MQQQFGTIMPPELFHLTILKYSYLTYLQRITHLTLTWLSLGSKLLFGKITILNEVKEKKKASDRIYKTSLI